MPGSVRRRFLPTVVITVATVVAASGCGGDASPAPPTTLPRSLISIEVADNSFTPSNLTVPRGTRVTWSWSGKNSHSVKGTWDAQPVESATQRSGSFALPFDKAGTFEYQCGVHGAAMSGRVTIRG